MHRRCLLRIIYLLILGSYTTSSASQSYSLSDCLKLISSHSVQIAQAVVNSSRAQAAYEEANKPKLPQLVAQGNLATASDIITQSNDANKAVIRIEQGTLPFGATWKLGTQRSIELEASHLSQVETTQDVEMLVKQLYFSILRDQDTMANINLVEEQFKRLMNDVVPRYQIGRAPSFDMVKVRSAIYDLTRNREVLKAQLAGERAQLAEVIGVKADENWIIQPIPHLPEVPAARISTLSFEKNPTFVTLNKQIEATDATISVAQASRLPALSAAVEYGLTGQSPETMVPSWNAYGQLRFTLFDWGLVSTQIAQAKADAELSRKKLEAETQRIESDFIQTRTLAIAHFDDQKRLQKLLPELKRASDSSIERYRKAAVGIIEATDSTSLWLQNLVNERAAYYGYLSDLAHLERVSGQHLEVSNGI